MLTTEHRLYLMLSVLFFPYCCHVPHKCLVVLLRNRISINLFSCKERYPPQHGADAFHTIPRRGTLWNFVCFQIDFRFHFGFHSVTATELSAIVVISKGICRNEAITCYVFLINRVVLADFCSHILFLLALM